MKNIDYDKLMENIVNNVNKYLNKLFDKYVVEAENISSVLTNIPLIARDFTLRGGKRLRAILVYIGYWSVEWGVESMNVLKLASMIEFLQSYLLVHDDIMDRDEIRRGGPTVHVWFRNKCFDEKLAGDCYHYGLSQAITVGDYLESLAVNMFSELDLPVNVIKDLIKTYTHALRTVSYGQFLDVLFSNKPLSEVSEEDVLLIHKLKTASYSVETPLHIGAIASTKYTRELLNELTDYAIPAGIVFQLKDDILGLFGDVSKTGKPIGSDVREKKKTILIIHAYRNASRSDQLFLEQVFERKSSNEISLDDIIRVQNIVRDTGSLDYVYKLMERESVKALKTLRESSYINDNAKKILEYLLELFMKREK
ncbi:MAG: polyprenyl synthetase family protein [Desulfurococcaceae archaeon]